jgi:protein-S-isoprenylcysteine O-methyltransferase Ste14
LNAAYSIFVNLLLSGLVVAAATLVLAADALWPVRLPEGLAPVAWPLFATGTLLITWAVITFRREAGGTGAVGDPPRRLVTSGPFRFMRNPIYVGAGGLLAAVALLRRSPSFLLAALAYLPLIHLYVLRVEEPRLAARFGEAYRRYFHAVPRWVPRRGSP